MLERENELDAVRELRELLLHIFFYVYHRIICFTFCLCTTTLPPLSGLTHSLSHGGNGETYKNLEKKEWWWCLLHVIISVSAVTGFAVGEPICMEPVLSLSCVLCVCINSLRNHLTYQPPVLCVEREEEEARLESNRTFNEANEWDRRENGGKDIKNKEKNYTLKKSIEIEIPTSLALSRPDYDRLRWGRKNHREICAEHVAKSVIWIYVTRWQK